MSDYKYAGKKRFCKVHFDLENFNWEGETSKFGIEVGEIEDYELPDIKVNQNGFVDSFKLEFKIISGSSNELDLILGKLRGNPMIITFEERELNKIFRFEEFLDFNMSLDMLKANITIIMKRMKGKNKFDNTINFYK